MYIILFFIEGHSLYLSIAVLKFLLCMVIVAYAWKIFRFLIRNN